jgi:hypothetical protein
MLIGVLKHALMITSFVLIMMLLIEYINVQTRGSWQLALRRSRFGQYVLGAFLGVVPGCLGAFTAVSLYSHRNLSFGALVATMIATSGDEAFVMFTLFPLKALSPLGFCWASSDFICCLNLQATIDQGMPAASRKSLVFTSPFA